MWFFVVLLVLGTAMTSLTSCRDTKKSAIEKAADDIGDAIDDVGDAID